ncbi:Xylose operon regulatory protein [compost metagenome]
MAGNNQKHVIQMLDIIHERYQDSELTVESVTESIGFSTNYARKLFKDQTGQSISVYLNEYRFNKAKELLLSTNLPAKRIGEMVGIPNHNYFYFSFKKITGKTPDQFRKS